jgi:hypothetical protein
MTTREASVWEAHESFLGFLKSPTDAHPDVSRFSSPPLVLQQQGGLA